MLKIWGRTNSINVQKVLWCCAELNLPFERIDAGMAFGVNNTPEYRKMNPNGRVPTIDDELVLFGDVLGISVADLITLSILVTLLLFVVRLLWKELLFATFDPLGAGAAGLPVRRLDDLLLILIAVTVVVSLQAVGIVLVVAMITTPAATAQLLTKRFAHMITVAAMIGIASSVAGLYVSYTMNLASGAAIVLIETLVFAGALTVVTVRNRMRAVRAGETSSS